MYNESPRKIIIKVRMKGKADVINRGRRQRKKQVIQQRKAKRRRRKMGEVILANKYGKKKYDLRNEKKFEINRERRKSVKRFGRS